ncbi:MAG: response regulator [Halanaerobiales bacterium]
MVNYILIVDDSRTVRASVKYALSKGSYQVEEAVNGKEALDFLIEQAQADKRPGMIITDVNMPVMDGISFVREVKKLRKLKFIPIIILTTESQDELKLEGKKAGAAGWLVKPFKAEQLLQLAKRFIR